MTSLKLEYTNALSLIIVFVTRQNRKDSQENQDLHSVMKIFTAFAFIFVNYMRAERISISLFPFYICRTLNLAIEDKIYDQLIKAL